MGHSSYILYVSYLLVLSVCPLSRLMAGFHFMYLTFVAAISQCVWDLNSQVGVSAAKVGEMASGEYGPQVGPAAGRASQAARVSAAVNAPAAIQAIAQVFCSLLAYATCASYQGLK